MNKLLILILLVAAAVMGQAYTDSIYNNFAEFADQYFTTSCDSLFYIYAKLPKDTVVLDTTRWRHTSVNSMCLFTATKLPARSRMEYGPTTDYGSFSDTTDFRHYYNHLHYATGLDSTTEYHYRMVYWNKKGDTLRTADSTFTTVGMANKLAIPGAMGSPPYNLTTGGKRYVLTANIEADSTAINVKAANDTIDLNGFTITYHKIAQEIDDINGPSMKAQSGCGIKAVNYKNGIMILNGKIIDGEGGAGTDSANAGGEGFNNILMNNSYHVVRGITGRWWTHSASGIRSNAGTIQYNAMYDYGWGCYNRDQGLNAIDLAYATSTCKVTHNSIRRTRHRGIQRSFNVIGNEIYSDGMFTNAFAIFVYNPSDSTGYFGNVFNNKIFITGYHTLGVSWWNRLKFSDNFVYGKSAPPSLSTVHGYGRQASLIGIRVTKYEDGTKKCDSLTYTHNIIVMRVEGDTAECRGIQMSSDSNYTNTRVDSNTVKVVRDDYNSYDRYSASNGFGNSACVVTQGVRAVALDKEIVKYNNNTFLSNYCFIRFGDYYANGGNGHKFKNNTFRKIDTLSDGDNPMIVFAGFSYHAQYNYDNQIINPIKTGTDFYMDTISYTKIFEGSYDYNGWYFLGYELTVNSDDGNEIVFIDKNDSVHYRDTIDGSSVTRSLFRFKNNMYKTRWKNIYEPFTVFATNGIDTTFETDYYPEYANIIDLYTGEAPLSAPIITLQPNSRTVNVGDTISFKIAGAGNPTPAYQWYYENDSLVGSTTVTYSIDSAAVGDSGTYFVIATNSEGADTSSTAHLTVNPTSTPIYESALAIIDTISGNTFTVKSNEWKSSHWLLATSDTAGVWSAVDSSIGLFSGLSDTLIYGGNNAQYLRIFSKTTK